MEMLFSGFDIKWNHNFIKSLKQSLMIKHKFVSDYDTNQIITT